MMKMIAERDFICNFPEFEVPSIDLAGFPESLRVNGGHCSEIFPDLDTSEKGVKIHNLKNSGQSQPPAWIDRVTYSLACTGTAFSEGCGQEPERLSGSVKRMRKSNAHS